MTVRIVVPGEKSAQREEKKEVGGINYTEPGTGRLYPLFFFLILIWRSISIPAPNTSHNFLCTILYYHFLLYYGRYCLTTIVSSRYGEFLSICAQSENESPYNI